MIKINVLGSCVSRVSLLDGVQSAHRVSDDRLDLGYFLDKQNIVCAMLPAPFSPEEVDTITVDELADKSRLHSLKQCLNKSTVPMLLESDAEYLVMDFYDMGINFCTYENTMFATQANEFCQTALYRKYADKIGIGNLYDIATCLWYGYIDLFMEKILTKYDSDHIIFNRFRCNTYYLNKDGKVSIIPDRGLLCQPNIKYNDRAFALEEYFIKKYNPWVIDLSKYFMGDQNDWDNLNGAHFEREFYRETFDQIKRIIFGETDKRVYDEPDFFNPDRRGYEEDMKRKFNVEYNLEILDVLMNNNDILWLNILDKLNSYAPEDPRVAELVAWMNQNNHE